MRLGGHSDSEDHGGHTTSTSPLPCDSPSSSSIARERERRHRGSSSSSSEVLQTTHSNDHEDRPSEHLFTPAGDVLPPIATSRSTTALLMKKKQLHQQQNHQNRLNISEMYPWTGHIDGGGSLSGSSTAVHSLNGVPNSPPPPPPPPNHPPPPYSVACQETPNSGTSQGFGGGVGSNGLGSHSRTPSSTFLNHSRNRSSSSSQVFSTLPLPLSTSRNRSPPREPAGSTRIYADLDGPAHAHGEITVNSSSSSPQQQYLQMYGTSSRTSSAVMSSSFLLPSQQSQSPSQHQLSSSQNFNTALPASLSGTLSQRPGWDDESHSRNRSSSSSQVSSTPSHPPSNSRNRSPLREPAGSTRIHLDLDGRAQARGEITTNSSSSSLQQQYTQMYGTSSSHSRSSSAATSSSFLVLPSQQSPSQSQHQSRSQPSSSQNLNTALPTLLRNASGGAFQRPGWDDESTPSSASDSDAAFEAGPGGGGGGAIYTSPSRKRKGKERTSASFDVDGAAGPVGGVSSSVHPLHEGSFLYDRRPRRVQVHDDFAVDSDDASPVISQSNPREQVAIPPKSCLKPTPSSSSASLATSHGDGGSTSLSTVQQPNLLQPAKSKPNIGVRFVRFTLGLGGKNSSKGKEREREREPKLICTTPGEACAGETETETDEPSQRRLPTSRRPPSASTPSRLGVSFGFGAWKSVATVQQQTSSSNLRSQPHSSASRLHPSSQHQSVSSPLRSNLSVSVSSNTTPDSENPSQESGSKVTRFLFQAFRLLSIVPALCGVIYCVLMLVSLGAVGSAGETERAREYMERYWRCVALPLPFVQPTSTLGGGGGFGILCDGGRGVLRGPPIPGRVDWVVAMFWALLTAHHCLGLSTGLLARWKLYYTPSSTLVRLLALQGICWPATQLTLSVVGGGRRPIAAWAVIGTCTAVSRSVQIWVTSNIVRDSGDDGIERNGDDGEAGAVTDEMKLGRKGSGAMVRFVHAFAAVIGGGHDGNSEDEDVPPVVSEDSGFETSEAESPGGSGTKKRGAKRNRERRWDWKEVGLKCMLPTGMAYFLMAWAEVGRREWGNWYHYSGLPLPLS